MRLKLAKRHKIFLAIISLWLLILATGFCIVWQGLPIQFAVEVVRTFTQKPIET